MDDNAADFIGGIPEHYDRGLVPFIFMDYATDMAGRAAADRPARVLETAAGTGVVTRRLRDLLPPASHLTATDLNTPMLGIARKKFRPGELIDLHPADALALPFGDGSFEAVVCQFGVMFFPDKDKSYREVHRVLTPGGRYLFNVWDEHRYNPFARITHALLTRTFPTDPPQFYQVPFSYHRVDPIKELLLEAGFTDIEVFVLSREQEIPDTEVFALGLIYGIPVIDQIRARGTVNPARLVEAVAADLGREFGTSPGRMPMQAILFSARKPG